MSKHLIESIISDDLLQASDIFEAKLNEIRARKMYEMKRMYQSEAFGGLTKDEIEMRKKAGYKKASEILGDPMAKKPGEKRLNPSAKIIKKKVAEDVLDEAGLGFGAQAAHGMSAQQKSQFKTLMSIRRKARQSGKPSDSGQSSSGYQRPNFIKRNINTLKGLEPGHVDDRTPEEKLKQKGGRIGKAIRAAADSPVMSDLHSIGMRNL